MKLSVFLAVAATLLCSACARTSRANAIAAANAPKSKNSTLPPIMLRQVLNAIDAGDGDYQTRMLREKMRPSRKTCAYDWIWRIVMNGVVFPK